VGTGFHPDLSGRENIFLNGAILGMTRAEVRRKFDEIVAFAEVEIFIDTPVKRYSSGMYVRLAFAVAAHLEPEILIIDEVLAVGDAQFQKKCLGKMNEVATQHGRTVLFVSHNFAAIESLCTRALYLEDGRLKLAASTAEVEQQFLADLAPTDGSKRAAGKIHNQHPAFIVEDFSAVARDRATTGAKAGESVTFRLRYRCTDLTALADGISVSVIFYVRGQRLLNLWSTAGHGPPFAVGEQGEICCEVPRWPFRTGSVRVDLHATYRMQNILEWEEALVVDSLDGDYYGTGVVPHETEGLMFLPHQWHGENHRPPAPDVKI
jgi:lipopolysaccharide transport system ATP-binding protein